MKKIMSFILLLGFVIGVLTIPMKSYAVSADSQAGKVSISSGRLNVRSSASTGGEILTTLGKGSYITLISKSGSWWKVEYAKGKYGYCSASYISVQSSSAKKVNITSGTLNVRSGAGTSYSKTASLTKGDIVLVLSTSSGWSRIIYNGSSSGYVSSQYLTTATATSSSYSAVSLSVPSFKQTDSRWANVQIGSSGKTISQIGCATTAIAMIESYRTGQTIYPNAMSKKLSYSSTGNLYWPSDYIAVTNSTGYLKGVYDKLKQKKPVLFGAKDSSGKQHWVVIVGFEASSSLIASKFKINDPGSNSRTNLQQFLNVYPNFYKYFYY